MPLAEYFEEGDGESPEYQDSITRAQTMLLDELCDRSDDLTAFLKEADPQNARALYPHPVQARDNFPQRINLNNLPDFPRNIGINILLEWEDTKRESNLGKVITGKHPQIELDTLLVQKSINALPEDLRYALKTEIERGFKQEPLVVSPSKSQQAVERIRTTLLSHMCRLDKDLYEIVIKPDQYPLPSLIDMAAMPVMGEKDKLTGKSPIICDVETTINSKPQSCQEREESFGRIVEYTDERIFLNEQLTEWGLASLTDAQQRLLYEQVLQEMVDRYSGKLEHLGTPEERTGIREMFARALYELLVHRPRSLKSSISGVLPRYQNFRQN